MLVQIKKKKDQGKEGERILMENLGHVCFHTISVELKPFSFGLIKFD